MISAICLNLMMNDARLLMMVMMMVMVVMVVMIIRPKQHRSCRTINIEFKG